MSPCGLCRPAVIARSAATTQSTGSWAPAGLPHCCAPRISAAGRCPNCNDTVPGDIMTLRIGIAGITGRMGGLLAEEVRAVGAELSGGIGLDAPEGAGFKLLPDLAGLA